jgi:RNA polymerase sigma-70 factor (ECF subfamily)
MPTPDAPDLAALLDRYERPLVRYAQSIVGDVDSARDVVQEVFIKLARGGEVGSGKLEAGSKSAAVNDGHRSDWAGQQNGAAMPLSTSDFRPPTSSHLEAWLFTVTRHRAIDHQRKHSRIIPMPLPDDHPCGAPSPAATLESRDAERSLLRLLDALSPNQREVIRLKFQNDLSYREIADVTQLSVTNVGFLLHTGLKKLRAMLAEQPQDDFGFPLRNSVL